MDSLKHAWSAFKGDNREPPAPEEGGVVYGTNQLRHRPIGYSTQRIIAPIITQIALDVSGVQIRHVRVDEEERYKEDIKSGLNECLLSDPNLDQSPAQFMQDVAMTMMEAGVAAIVPVETTFDPEITGGYDVKQLRCGVVTQWYPAHVRVDLYDERTGVRREIILPKKMVAICQNPLYNIMNEPNSTLQRLLAKLRLLDVTDDRLSSGKLDIILQLPYQIKHETRRAEAEKRLNSLEGQLAKSVYGIGYIDGTERITQLNRPSENNLLMQVESLEKRLYTQLGLTEEIFFGTADEAAMINYNNRTVYPIIRAIQEEMRRKFLTKTARSQGQSIEFFRNPFALVPVNQLAEIADKFTRNEIMAPNEFRPIVGLKPVSDPDANKLRNRNMPEVDVKENKETEEKPDTPESPTGESEPATDIEEHDKER